MPDASVPVQLKLSCAHAGAEKTDTGDERRDNGLIQLIDEFCTDAASEGSLVGGYLPLAPGVSTVRYPIPERIFDYVSTVRSATAGTCHAPT